MHVSACTGSLLCVNYVHVIVFLDLQVHDTKEQRKHRSNADGEQKCQKQAAKSGSLQNSYLNEVGCQESASLKEWSSRRQADRYNHYSSTKHIYTAGLVQPKLSIIPLALI